MFGIGTGELLLLFIIALVVLGPERLPGLARDIGKTMQDLRKTSDELTTEFLRADEEAKKLLKLEPAAAVSQPIATPSSAEPTAASASTESAQSEASEPPPPQGEESTAFDQEAQRAIDERERARQEGQERKEVPEGWKIPEDVPEPDRTS